MRHAGDIGLLFTFIGVVVYTIVYFWRSPWRKSPLTIIFATKNVLVVFIIGQVVLSVFYGEDYWGRDWFRLIDYALCGAAYVALIVFLWRMQSEDRRQWKSDESDAYAENERDHS